MIPLRPASCRTSATARSSPPATATSGSATSRSRSRFDRAAGSGLLGCLALAAAVAGGCGDDDADRGEVVARVAGEGEELALDRRVVAQIAAREGITAAEAEARALETLRLVAARRAELAAREQPPEHPDDLDPARREYLERAAIVQLWLDEVFEPAHTAADIPAKVVAQNMADPALVRRLFHPQLWFVCQALVLPAETGDDGRHVEPPQDGEAAQAWREAAGEAFAGLVGRAQTLEDELLADPECGLFGRITGASERSFTTAAGPVVIRFERFAFAPSAADTLDRDWLAEVTASATPRLVGPFPTRFGLHLVAVTKIEPAHLADGSLPPAELAAAREAALREEIEQAWRADQLERTLTELRDRHVVRLAPELE